MFSIRSFIQADPPWFLIARSKFTEVSVIFNITEGMSVNNCTECLNLHFSETQAP